MLRSIGGLQAISLVRWWPRASLGPKCRSWCVWVLPRMRYTWKAKSMRFRLMRMVLPSWLITRRGARPTNLPHGCSVNIFFKLNAMRWRLWPREVLGLRLRLSAWSRKASQMHLSRKRWNIPLRSRIGKCWNRLFFQPTRKVFLRDRYGVWFAGRGSSSARVKVNSWTHFSQT